MQESSVGVYDLFLSMSIFLISDDPTSVDVCVHLEENAHWLPALYKATVRVPFPFSQACRAAQKAVGDGST